MEGIQRVTVSFVKNYLFMIEYGTQLKSGFLKCYKVDIFTKKTVLFVEK